MEKTTKADWFTKYLEQKKFWVGGTEVTYKANFLTSATQTIRYFRARTSEFLVVYILEFIEPLDQKTDYETAIKFYSSGIPIKSNFTLAIWQNEPNKFAILEGGNLRQNLDDQGVLAAFGKFDPALIGESNYLKPINRSFTDFFHLWSRKYMKGFVNDIDALIENAKDIHMLELKRPKEKINTWNPYKADSVNYLQFATFCSQLNYKLTNIAYSEAELRKVKVFKDVTLSGQNLKYRTATLEIDVDDDFLLSIEKLKFCDEVSSR